MSKCTKHTKSYRMVVLERFVEGDFSLTLRMIVTDRIGHRRPNATLRACSIFADASCLFMSKNVAILTQGTFWRSGISQRRKTMSQAFYYILLLYCSILTQGTFNYDRFRTIGGIFCSGDEV